MATVNNAFTGIPVSFLLETVGGTRGDSFLPRCRVQSSTSHTIPALGAGDVGVNTYTLSLPSGFSYQLLDARVKINGPALADLADFAPYLNCQFVEDGVIHKRGMMVDTGFFGGTRSFQALDPANTNDFTNLYYWAPGDAIYQTIFQGGMDGDVVLSAILLDPNPITAAVTIFYEFDFLQFTVEQARKATIYANLYSRH